MNKSRSDDEEKALAESYERGEWRSIKNVKRERRKLSDAAGETVQMTLDPQITGNVGLYYCCYRLSLLGWNVMPTSRNARGVDIIVYNRNAQEFHGIQVKSLSKRNPVPLGSSLDKVIGDFWIIVNKVATEQPSAYVLLPSEVKERARQSGNNNDRVSFWLLPADYEQDSFHEAWDRIGRD